MWIKLIICMYQNIEIYSFLWTTYDWYELNILAHYLESSIIQHLYMTQCFLSNLFSA